MQLYDCAINYLNAGLAVLPADKKQKRPLLSGWKQFQDRDPTVFLQGFDQAFA